MTRIVQHRTGFFALGGVGLVVALTVSAAAPPVSSTDAEFFHRKIQPLLAERCFECHSHAADKIKGNLVVDSLAGLLQGGDSGPALVPGDPEKSLFIKAVRQADADLRMPP